MGTKGQQGSLRLRRGPGRDKDPGPGIGMEATCWLTPGTLRRFIELPSPPLSRHQLKRLEEHRYSSAGRSLLEPLMQRYWEWLSLDAIDGKQARRTNSSSPLGELFDHGCDSLSTVFVVLGTSIAVQLGTNPDWMFFCCFAGMFMFYCAHWQTYVSGTLRFGIIDVTEVQIFIIIMYLLAAIGGSTLWQSLGTSVLSPVLHIGSVIMLAIMIYKKSAVQLFERHPCLYILAFGFVAAKITNKLVVAHMTKSEMHLHDLAFLGPGLLFLDQYFNSFIDEYLVLWIALILSFFDLLRYCVSVCNQIASHLRIFVFKIKALPPSALH
ncbi:hypothetical protein NHX12_030740 [Muraenolepis orangiensis]|uniref:Choline/ethanolaminephosphotransferase 1 n=1 Tax=Muraenolepis orangiensis TaxID=630683 RepID=A0A9Q0IN57_9TELE|nr:hypothetical protein NHX12_030740 [Muraenolepis orangiensis]